LARIPDEPDPAAPRGWAGGDADLPDTPVPPAVSGSARDADVPENTGDANRAAGADIVHVEMERESPLRWLDVAASVLFGLVMARMLTLWFWHPGGTLLVRALAGFVVIAGFFATARRAFTFLRDYVKGREPRIAAYVITAIGFFGAFVQPIQLARFGAADLKKELAAAEAGYASVRSELDRRWRNDIKAADAHGRNGLAPPFLGVDDRGRSVRLVNLFHNELICLRVRRANSTGTESCNFKYIPSDGCRNILRGEDLKLELEADAPASCTDLPLEFAIGQPTRPTPTWWSDGALRAFDAGEMPDAQSQMP
jgi:hypothetical protein